MILRPYSAAVCPARGGGCTETSGASGIDCDDTAGDKGGVIDGVKVPLESDEFEELDNEFGVSGLEPLELIAGVGAIVFFSGLVDKIGFGRGKGGGGGMPPEKLGSGTFTGVAGADPGGEEDVTEAVLDDVEATAPPLAELGRTSFFFFLRIPGCVHVSVSRLRTCTSLRRF